MHYSSSPALTPSTGWIDNRMSTATRLILAASALLAVTIDPSGLERYALATHIVLALYLAYAGALYLLALRRSHVAVYGIAPWIDTVWYSVLMMLSGGSNSIFFFFYFFAILIAAFRWGFSAGLRVALVSAILFATVGIVMGATQRDLELNRFLLRLIYLLVLGYMIAYWGGLEISLKHRLSLLKEVTALANPRFGVDHTLGLLLERLRAFYDADACVLATLPTADQIEDEQSLRRADRRNPQRAMRAEAMMPELADRLLALPPQQAVVYSSEPRGWWPRGMSYYAYDVVGGERTEEGRKTCEMIAFILDAESMTSVPLRYHHQTIGRLFLTSRRRSVFDDFDPDFLLQIMEQVMPVVQNIRLVDRLASDAAEQERRRIARDLHDSVIQPYIGLQSGLASVQLKLAAGRSDIGADVDKLSTLVATEIADLRRYVHGLRDAAVRENAETTLMPAVRRFGSKFAGATGIAVDIEAAQDIVVNDRLAAEAFQIVVEGLNNIRKHTAAGHATITLGQHDSALILQVRDYGAPISPVAAEPGAPAPHPPFTPRSITERARALGGSARVEQHETGSAVIVEIPL